MEEINRENMSFPKDAKKVFEGIIFDVYQWEQELFDGTKRTFEGIKRLDTAVVIVMVDDKILIQKQEQPGYNQFLSLPGGRCERGEETLSCAKRELLEETGYSSDDFVLWKSFSPSKKIIWTIDYYIARNCQKISEPKLEAGEKIENDFISFDEFIMLSEQDSFLDDHIKQEFLYLRLHPEKLGDFKRLLFGR